MQEQACPHPPARQYSLMPPVYAGSDARILYVCCLACREIILVKPLPAKRGTRKERMHDRR